ncbi:MAG: type II toxin-antitoxin system Phd/YefM family antitoxin [Myxococcaceae bacterium]
MAGRKKPPKSIGSEYARAHLPELLTRVEEGEAIEISRRGRKVAVLMSARDARLPVATAFSHMRGSGQKQWGEDIAAAVGRLRGEWD